MNLEFCRLFFFLNSQISNFAKIFSAGYEMFHADGQTDMTKLINVFRNFENVPNKVINVTTVL